MTPAAESKTKILVCETCRRPLGKAQLECPRRAFSGEEGCTYQVEVINHVSRHKGFVRYIALVVGLVLIIGWVSLLFFEVEWEIISSKVFSWAGLLGVVFVLTWVYRNFGKTLVARNSQRGMEVIETSLFGILVQRVEIGPDVVVPWEGSPARKMRYPASVVELYRNGNAADLISTAVLQLVAQGAVQIGYTRTQRRFRKSRQRYRLMPPEEDFSDILVVGELEKRILGLVLGWSQTGMLLGELIADLFEGGKLHPRNFLVDEIIGPESQALGLGEVRGHLNHVFVPAPNTRGRVAVDIQSVKNLYRDFWTNSPKHAEEMLAEIDRLVIAMARAE